ncbi:uncharacterized protein BJ212DRAFT_1381081 [Suillus subaureus]|uniref:Uncharacterized protein n=1 Tax=Suillus subaureus TaxID=48587 RepID=A0A9P7E1W9_9AGAM|nr:uncharacterized protein BJ212DRAFT_1381081 [Suillus subaureus]KAG1809199.1 hypothetical protein BJ212DRAFT_1381081 [Suillus subaureus]
MPRTRSQPKETFPLGPFTVSRVWVGLWQLSSNAWGSASAAKIRQAMARHNEMGYNAFGESQISSHVYLPAIVNAIFGRYGYV